MSRLNSSIRHDLQRSYPINSLVRTKSLHSLAPLCHPPTSRQSPSCTSGLPHLMLEPATPNPIPDQFQPPPRQSLSTMNQNSKSPKSSTPRLTTDIAPANYLYLVRWTGYEGTDEETSMDHALSELDMTRTWLDSSAVGSRQLS